MFREAAGPVDGLLDAGGWRAQGERCDPTLPDDSSTRLHADEQAYLCLDAGRRAHRAGHATARISCLAARGIYRVARA